MRSLAIITSTMRSKGSTQTSSSPGGARGNRSSRRSHLGLTSTNAPHRQADGGSGTSASAVWRRRWHPAGAVLRIADRGFRIAGDDTDVLRTIDERQWAWIERALGRSRGKFIMAIVGHPRFAGGRDLPPTAEGTIRSNLSCRWTVNSSARGFRVTPNSRAGGISSV
jgi:hypothetical protein